jgi:hypothetical protein
VYEQVSTASGGGGNTWVPQPSSGTLLAATEDLLTTGEETIHRNSLVAVMAADTGVARLTYFTARKTEPSTQVRVRTGGVAAGATPTLCRIGLYEIASNGDGTLVASTVNDTALFAGANTGFTRSWSTPVTKTAGKRYALAVLVVTAQTAPQLLGLSIASSAEAATAPALAGSLLSQADLPASFTAASVTASGARVYGAILP